MRTIEEICYRDWVSDAMDLLLEDITRYREEKKAWKEEDDE